MFQIEMPKSFNLAILDYETERSVYSFDYNERNMEEHYQIFSNNTIQIRLPFMKNLVANKRYYIIFNKHPYAIYGCEVEERSIPMNKDQWYFETQSKYLLAYILKCVALPAEIQRYQVLVSKCLSYF